MSSDDDLIVACAAFVVMSSLTKKKKKRRYWMTRLYHDRLLTRGPSFLHGLFNEQDGHFQNFVRMSQSDFSFILESIREKISKTDTNFRRAITAEERLAVTLRFLASGDSFTSLKYVFNISTSLISQIVPEVCKAIIETLKDYVQVPASPEEWLEIANLFEKNWNFPHCVGALDGKHIPLICPINSGSLFYNYKSFFSIVLMALADADYNFIYVDIGSQGGVSDGGVFKNCTLYKNMVEKKLNLPMPSALPNMTKEVPYVFVGDQAFALSDNIMKPYSGTHPKGSSERIFNYRLSRARRVSENAFGILSAAFRVLRKPLLLEPKKAELIVLATVCLHNFLRRSPSSRNIYAPDGFFDKEQDGRLVRNSWRTENDANATSLLQLKKIPRKSPSSASQIRDVFADYFITTGAVSWQDQYA